VFVPAATEGGETDGWYMGLVINVDSDTTDLVLLSAADFAGPPVAVIHLPHRIPPGFHGNWVEG
jgi:carotenoid cleavage dioxygenase